MNSKTLFLFQEISPSLAPPPLDPTLTVEERMEHLQSCLQNQSGQERAVVTYDFIQSYKVLLLSCGVSLEPRYEDPKVLSTCNSMNGNMINAQG